MVTGRKSLFVGNLRMSLGDEVLISRYLSFCKKIDDRVGAKTTKAVPQNRQGGNGFCGSVLTIIQQAVQVFPLQEYHWRERWLQVVQLSVTLPLVLLFWVLPWQAQWL